MTSLIGLWDQLLSEDVPYLAMASLTKQ